MGYPSLFEFCVSELGYSGGAAQRRIAVMRLVKELPQVEEKIISGELSLSVAAQTQAFFKKQERDGNSYEREEKLALLRKLEHTSARECERVLVKLDPGFVRADRERQVTEDLIELRLTVDREFMEKVEQLKNVLSHALPGGSTKDVITYAVNELLKKKASFGVGSSAGAARGQASRKGETKSNCASRANSEFKLTDGHARRGGPVAVPKSARYIPADLRREVWRRDGGQCTYVDLKSGRRCGSRRYLEVDHIVPVAKGGKSELANLRLLCDSHNRWKRARLNSQF